VNAQDRDRVNGRQDFLCWAWFLVFHQSSSSRCACSSHHSGCLSRRIIFCPKRGRTDLDFNVTERNHLRVVRDLSQPIFDPIFESEERVAVDATGTYEARCRQCFVPHADAPTIDPDSDPIIALCLRRCGPDSLGLPSRIRCAPNQFGNGETILRRNVLDRFPAWTVQDRVIVAE
jgi:hypothetical protein